MLHPQGLHSITAFTTFPWLGIPLHHHPHSLAFLPVSLHGTGTSTSAKTIFLTLQQP